MQHRILIVEDEIHIADRLAGMLQRIDKDLQVIHTCGSIHETLNWLDNNETPDLGFFDVQLSDGVSFEIMNRKQMDFPVIFTTAYDEYAIQALRLRAINYLLKPVNKTELIEAIERYKKQSTRLMHMIK